jgi:GDP-mannose 6-dehydrogenase
MKILIIGLGYVGAVTGSALADMGHEVTVADIDEAKVGIFNDGHSPIPEPGLDDLIRKGVAAGRLNATTKVAEAAKAADVAIISVGTPTDESTGDPDLTAVERVAVELSEVLGDRDAPLLVAVASTVPPGTTEGLVRPILETTGGDSEKFHLCFLPEFLREGTSIEDFRNPTRFVVGARTPEEAEPFRQIRADIPERHYVAATEVAELQKSAENCWHATKVTFANELGRIAEANGIDANLVMDLLLADTKQNVSAAYMRPGFAFGGSCLPKDLRSIVRLADKSGVEAPMLAGIAESISEHVSAAVRKILALGKPKVGILGLAFKAGTDDLRESPAVALVQALAESGVEVAIHDYDLTKSPIFGKNLHEWDRNEELRNQMTESVEDLIANSDLLVITQYNRRYLEALADVPNSVEVIDLTGMTRSTTVESPLPTVATD